MAMATQLTEDEVSVLRAIKDMALQTGREYTLASGKVSDYFLDMKPVLNDSDVLSRIARLMLRRIPPETDAVGGSAMGSIPISTAIILLCKQESTRMKALRGFWVRPEPKQHGLGGVVGGRVEPSDRVVIVDDVTTTGTSVRRAIRVVQDCGAKVLKVISLVDREEGAREAFAEIRIPFESLFKRTEILKK